LFQAWWVEVFPRRERVRITGIVEGEVGDAQFRKPARFVDPEGDREVDICVLYLDAGRVGHFGVWR
jgi:hypothetical protein